MLNHLFNFMQDEDGAVTVDWVVLTAAIVGMAFADAIEPALVNMRPANIGDRRMCRCGLRHRLNLGGRNPASEVSVGKGNAMRMVFGLVLVVGLALAGVAVYMVQGYIAKRQAPWSRNAPHAPRPVRWSRSLWSTSRSNYGDPLTKEDVQMIYWPRKRAARRRSSATRPRCSPKTTTSRAIVLRPMEKFEPVLAVKVTEPGEDAGLTGASGQGHARLCDQGRRRLGRVGLPAAG